MKMMNSNILVVCSLRRTSPAIKLSGILALMCLGVSTVIPCQVMAQYDEVREIYEDTRAVGQRFIDGALNTHGSASDRLIEGLIEATTPQADERTRRVQRRVARFLLATNDAELDESWDLIIEGIELAVRSRAIISERPDRSDTHEFPEVCDYGRAPGEIQDASGCLAGECPGWTGSFSVIFGMGVTMIFGPEEPFVNPYFMNVYISEGQEGYYLANLEFRGHQSMADINNVLVVAQEEVLIFRSTPDTEFLYMIDYLAEAVGPESPGEIFSVLMSGHGEGIVNWGHLEYRVGNILGRPPC